ncbi:hypothetical protein MQ093_09560 [Edwardsiella anguillarum]|uniref:hypothetical protein n=1 Tax=Edwardsiella anguillarum TaxID=1821960 RepID=UPI0024B6AF48|nr:hypothetical protein [Edwardsiella anguillarum]WHQ26762.1 hypothetical protein MQ093_09560 [Edwardsiella anguillarum]
MTETTLIPFDFASFMLSGNILIKLVEKNILSLNEAKEIIKRARLSAPNADSFRHDKDIDLDWHFENLIASLEACSQKG